MKSVSGSFLSRWRNKGLSVPVTASLRLRVLGLLLLYLSQVILARLMGVKAYGDYTVILTIINFLLVFSLFGLDTTALRFIPAARAKKAPGEVHGFIRFSSRVITLLSVLAGIGLFIFILLKAKHFNIGFAEGVFWAVLLLPFLAWIHQSSAILRAFHKISTSLMGIYILLPVLLTLGCLYYYGNHDKLPVDAAMLVYMICAVIVAVILSRKVSRNTSRLIEPAAPVMRGKVWATVSFTLFLTTLLNLFLRQSDILFVSYLAGNSKAGIYGAAVRISTLVSIGLSVTDYVYMPKIAALWEARKLLDLRDMVRTASRQIALLTLPVVVFLVVAGKWLLGYFGTAFEQAYVPLIILICGQCVNSMTGMVGGLLSMTGHQGLFLFFYVVSAVLQVALLFFLIPHWGLTGAATASALALILLNVSGYLYVRIRMKIAAGLI